MTARDRTTTEKANREAIDPRSSIEKVLKQKVFTKELSVAALLDDVDLFDNVTISDGEASVNGHSLGRIDVVNSSIRNHTDEHILKTALNLSLQLEGCVYYVEPVQSGRLCDTKVHFVYGTIPFNELREHAQKENQLIVEDIKRRNWRNKVASFRRATISNTNSSHCWCGILLPREGGNRCSACGGYLCPVGTATKHVSRIMNVSNINFHMRGKCAGRHTYTHSSSRPNHRTCDGDVGGRVVGARSG